MQYQGKVTVYTLNKVNNVCAALRARGVDAVERNVHPRQEIYLEIADSPIVYSSRLPRPANVKTFPGVVMYLENDDAADALAKLATAGMLSTNIEANVAPSEPADDARAGESLASAKARVDLYRENTATMAKLQATRLQLANVTAQAIDLQAKLDAAMAIDLRVQLDTATARVREVETQRDIATARVREVETQRDTARASAIDIQAQWRAANKERDPNPVQTIELRKRIDMAETEIAELRTQRDLARQAFEQVAGQDMAIAEDRARMQAELAELRTKVEAPAMTFAELGAGPGTVKLRDAMIFAVRLGLDCDDVHTMFAIVGGGEC
jgi:hypothetical protein